MALTVSGTESHPDQQGGSPPDQPEYPSLCQINLRYNQSNETLFKDIIRLPAGHYLIWESDNIRVKPYYQFPEFHR